MALVIFFCSGEDDPTVLADEMRQLFAGVQVVGGTTAGEIGLAGYLGHSLAGASLPASGFSAVSGRIGDLRQFKIAAGQTFAHEQVKSMAGRSPRPMPAWLERT